MGMVLLRREKARRGVLADEARGSRARHGSINP
jgi:hypothetical protein